MPDALTPPPRPRGGPDYLRLARHWPGEDFSFTVGPTDPPSDLGPLALALVLYRPDSGTRLELPGRAGTRVVAADGSAVTFALADSATLTPGEWEAHVYAGVGGSRRHWLWASFESAGTPGGA